MTVNLLREGRNDEDALRVEGKDISEPASSSSAVLYISQPCEYYMQLSRFWGGKKKPISRFA